MTEPAVRKKTKKDALSESEEDLEPDVEEGGAEAADAGGPIEKAVVQLTKLMTIMAKTRSSRGGLEGILDKVDTGGRPSRNSRTPWNTIQSGSTNP